MDVNFISILASNPNVIKELYVSMILNNNKPFKLGFNDPSYIPYIQKQAMIYVKYKKQLNTVYRELRRYNKNQI